MVHPQHRRRRESRDERRKADFLIIFPPAVEISSSILDYLCPIGEIIALMQ